MQASLKLGLALAMVVSASVVHAQRELDAAGQGTSRQAVKEQLKQGSKGGPQSTADKGSGLPVNTKRDQNAKDRAKPGREEASRKKQQKVDALTIKQTLAEKKKKEFAAKQKEQLDKKKEQQIARPKPDDTAKQRIARPGGPVEVAPGPPERTIGKIGGPTTVEVAPGPPDVVRAPLKPAGVPTPYPNTLLTPLDRPTVAQPVQRPGIKQPVLRPVPLPRPVVQPVARPVELPKPVLQPVRLPQPVKAPPPVLQPAPVVLQPAPVKLQPLPMPVQTR